MEKMIPALIIYYFVMNLIASFMAIRDKDKAKKGKWRISEDALMLIAFLGGAFGEFLTMKKIHHKTRHAKFMVGLPVAVFIHTIIIALIFYKVALI